MRFDLGKSWIILLGTLVLLLTSCSDSEKKVEDSDLKWGHLPHARYQPLLNVPPNGTVSLCGVGQQEAKEAIEVWAEQIGRKGHIKFDLNCGPGTRVNIKFISQAQMCAIYGLASNCNVKGSAGADGLSLLQPLHKGILLHEIGHFWGLCDQYAGTVGQDNCDIYHRTPVRSGKTSVMGASLALQLAPDDITGIRDLAARTDIPANNTWRQYLGR